MPAVHELLASPFARGAVSGIGLITMLAGVIELGGAFAYRFRRPAGHLEPGHSAER